MLLREYAPGQYGTGFAVLRASMIMLILAGGIRTTASASSERMGAPTASAASASVQGTVIAAGSGEPLPGAEIELTMDEPEHHPQFHGTTDNRGRFLITVPAGHYEFRVSKDGYVVHEFGGFHEEDFGDTDFDVTSGHVLNVLFRLRRAAMLVGRITDEKGRPIAGAAVDAIIARTRQTRNDMSGVPVDEVITNDLGEYQIAGLPAGRYYVAAYDSCVSRYFTVPEVRRLASDIPCRARVDSITGRPPLYFPGVTQLNQAKSLRLIGGGKMRVDISLRSQKMATISGTVFDPAGKPAAQSVVFIETQSVEIASLGLAWGTDDQGRFEIRGVPPGRYVVNASGGGYGGPLYEAEQSINVGAASVPPIQLQLRPGVSITARLTASGGANVDLRDLSVGIFGADVGGGWGAPPQDGGHTFIFRELWQGTYIVDISNVPDGWYVSSASFGGDDVFDTGLKIGKDPAQPTLEVAIRPGAVKIQGVVSDEGSNPVTCAVVKLVPELAHPYRMGLNRTTTTDQHGHYVFKNIPPGSYRVLAVHPDYDDGDDSAAGSPSGAKIAVLEGQSMTVLLKLAAREP